MNTSKIYSLLNSDDLDPNTKCVIIANYFGQLCVEDRILQLIADPRTDMRITVEVLERFTYDAYYGSNANFGDVLILIYKSRQRYVPEVIAQTILSMAAYDVTLIFDEIIGGTVSDDLYALYGPVVEYLICLLDNNPSRLAVIVSALTERSMCHDGISRDTLSILFELVSIKSDDLLNSGHASIRDLIAGLLKTKTINQIEALFGDLGRAFADRGIIFFDYNQILGTLHCRYFSGVSFSATISSIDKSRIGLFQDVVDNMVPLILNLANCSRDDIDDIEVFLNLAERDMLIMPCVNNGYVIGIICLLAPMEILKTDLIGTMLVSKYLALSMSASADDLFVLTSYDDYIQQHSFAVRSFTHEVAWALGDMCTAISDVQKSPHLSLNDREQLDTCLNARSVIDDAAKTMCAYSDPTWSIKEINGIVKVVIRAMTIPIKENKVKLTPGYSLEPLYVYSGSGITTIITNILSNAIKAVQNNQVDDRLIHISVKRNDDSVFIEVADNGPGIDERIRPRMFQPGVSTGGSGLGLTIVRRLLDQLDGDIVYEGSNMGSGTNARVILPLGDKDEGQDSSCRR
jgi:hypothetical protein